VGKRFVVFTVGRDKPGIVAGISEVLYQLGCNIEDSSMTILRNQFAMILIVDAPDEVARNKLEKSLSIPCERLGLELFVKEVNSEDMIPPAVKTHCLIKVFGEDKTGIVYKVSKYLASKRINIADMRTKLSGGEKKLYVMLIEAEIPEDVDVESMKRELEKIAEELEVDLIVEEVPTIHM